MNCGIDRNNSWKVWWASQVDLSGTSYSVTNFLFLPVRVPLTLKKKSDRTIERM